MVNFIWAVSASLVVSIISLVGIFTLLLKDDLLDKILFLLISFAAGGLIGGAFLHLLPESLERSGSSNIFLYVILGFILFFILEKYLYWRHCHKENCATHVFTYLNLIGDTVHNLSDGLVIGASFVVNIHFGLVTTLVIIFHEIPQEIGDFGVLVYGGFNKSKALFYNFISGLACVLGTLVGFFLSAHNATFSIFLLPITAGGFIYVAACDLIPELHKQTELKRTAWSFFAFLAGILFILLARSIPFLRI
ncbi:MAG: ZIP family metal transporter [Candidatus Omnitrophota bacterium]